MVQLNSADFALFRNQQIQINEKIVAFLWNLEALMDVVLSINSFELTHSTMHSYFSVVDDLIKNIIQLHQMNLKVLHKQ